MQIKNNYSQIITPLLWFIISLIHTHTKQRTLNKVIQTYNMMNTRIKHGYFKIINYNYQKDKLYKTVKIFISNQFSKEDIYQKGWLQRNFQRNIPQNIINITKNLINLYQDSKIKHNQQYFNNIFSNKLSLLLRRSMTSSQIRNIFYKYVVFDEIDEYQKILNQFFENLTQQQIIKILFSSIKHFKIQKKIDFFKTQLYKKICQLKLKIKQKFQILFKMCKQIQYQKNYDSQFLYQIFYVILQQELKFKNWQSLVTFIKLNYDYDFQYNNQSLFKKQIILLIQKSLSDWPQNSHYQKKKFYEALNDLHYNSLSVKVSKLIKKYRNKNQLYQQIKNKLFKQTVRRQYIQQFFSDDYEVTKQIKINLLNTLNNGQLSYQESLKFQSNISQIIKYTTVAQLFSQKNIKAYYKLIKNINYNKQKIDSLLKFAKNIESIKFQQLSRDLKMKKMSIQNSIYINKIQFQEQLLYIMQRYQQITLCLKQEYFITLLQQQNRIDNISSYQWVKQLILLFQSKIKEMVDQFKQQQMTIQKFKCLFFKIKIEDFDNFFNNQNQLIKNNINKYTFYIKQQTNTKLKNIYKSLLFLSQFLNLQMPQQMASNYKQIFQISQQQINQSKVSIYCSKLQDLSLFYSNLGLKIDKKSSINNFLTTFCQHQQLIKFIKTLNQGQIKALQDFISQDDQNMMPTINEFATLYKTIQQMNKIKNLRQFINEFGKENGWLSQMQNQGFVLSMNLKNCDAQINNIKMKIQQSSDRSFSFKGEIQQILKQSFYYISKQKHQNWQLICKFNDQGKEKIKNLKQLKYFRDKTKLFLAQLPKDMNQQLNQGNQEKRKLFTIYHEFFECIQRIYNYVQSLLQDGYPPQGVIQIKMDVRFSKISNLYSQKNTQQFLIVCASSNRMQQLHLKVKQLQQNSKKWSKYIKDLRRQSFVANHCNGYELYQLVQNIKNKGQDPIVKSILSLYQKLFDEQQRQQIKEQLSIQQGISIHQVIRSYFLIFKKIKQFQKIDKKNKQSPIIVFNEPQNQALNYQIAFSYEQVSVSDILPCTNTTTIKDIQRFLQRSLMSNKKSFIFGAQYLKNQIQVDFLDRLKQFNEQKRLQKTDLVFIDNNVQNKIYQVLVSRSYNKKVMRKQDIDLSKGKRLLIQQIKPACTIVTSQDSSTGKSYYIQNACKEIKKNPKYLYLAGVIQQDFLKQSIQNLKLTNDDALIIQIGQLINYQAINIVLPKILLFKCLHVGRLNIPKDIHIYIQVQNIHGQNPLQKIHILNMLSKYQSFHFKIPKFNLDCINYEEQSQILKYNTQMLEWIQTDRIIKQDFVYQPLKPCIAAWKNYLKKYLFDPIEQGYKQKVSAHLYSYFMKKLYSNFKAFNCGLFMVSILVQDQINPVLRKQLLLIIIKNTLQFVKQYVSTTSYQGDNKSKQQFRQQIKKMDLLIIPCSQGGFKFIYSDSSQIPASLKQYLCLNKQSDVSKFDQLFTVQKMANQEVKVKYMLQTLSQILNRQHISLSQTFKFTYDNFYKMAIILYRMESGLPVILMGQSGVGKTRIVSQLANILNAKFINFQVHAGKKKKEIHNFISQVIQTKKQMDQKKQQIQRNMKQIKNTQDWINNYIKTNNITMKQFEFIKNPKIIVLIDQYNTTQELYYFKEIMINKRYNNKQIPNDLIFIACCNPYRKRVVMDQNPQEIGLNFMKADRRSIQNNLDFKVFPPPQTMRKTTWDYQQLLSQQIYQYSIAILKDITTKQRLSTTIVKIHSAVHKKYGLSFATLRDVERLRRLYMWFLKCLPRQHVRQNQLVNTICKNYYRQVDSNINLDFQTRVLIVSLCSCYVSKGQTQRNKQEIIEIVASSLGKQPGDILKIYKNQQFEFIKRMSSPFEKVAVNNALNENIFLMLVSIMNKIPFLLIGVPGCSKSLSVSLIQSNLKGKDSKNSFYRQFPEVRFISLQASQTSTSEDFQNIFNRAKTAYEKMIDYKEHIIFVVLIDQIGLAQYSADNPLKVIHSRLQLTQTQYSCVAISNWKLDNAKVARFLVCNRTYPDRNQITTTAKQLLRSYCTTQRQWKQNQFLTSILSRVYFQFNKTWKSDQSLNKGFKQFFGLRDLYSFMKYIFQKIIIQKQQSIAEVVNNSVKINFDGQDKSIQTFLNICLKESQAYRLAQNQNIILQQGVVLQEIYQIGQKIDPIQQCQHILQTHGTRSLMIIVPSDVLLYRLNKLFKGMITLHGSSFQGDLNSSDYNLSKIAQIVTYLAHPYKLAFKDMNASIFTAFYDFFNQCYTQSGQKLFCRIASGPFSKSNCQIHKDLKAIVFVQQQQIRKGNVDSAFLNRFCKIYFKLNRFLDENQLNIVYSIEGWMKNLFKFLSNKMRINTGNFIINSSQSAICSLILDLSDKNIQNIQQQAKKILIKNSTLQFKFALKFNKLRLPKQYLQNNLNNNQDQHEIIFTTDQLAQYNDSLYDYDPQTQQMKINCQVIKLSQIKQQKQFMFYVNKFLQGKQKYLKIKMNYEKDYGLKNQIMFKIDQIIKSDDYKKSVRINGPKIFIVIIFLKRFKLTSDYISLSYLYPYRQRYMQILPKPNSQLSSQAILNSTNLLQLYQIINEKSLQISITKIINESLYKLNFQYQCPVQYLNNLKQSFQSIINDFAKNQIFLKYFIRKLKQLLFQKKIDAKFYDRFLNDNYIFSLSLSTVEALKEVIKNFVIQYTATLLIIFIQKGILFLYYPYETLNALRIETQLFKMLQIMKAQPKRNMKKQMDQILKNNTSIIKNIYLSSNQQILELFHIIFEEKQIIKNSIVHIRYKNQRQGNKVKVKLPTLFPLMKSQIAEIIKDKMNYDLVDQNIDTNSSKIHDLAQQLIALQKLEGDHFNEMNIIRKKIQMLTQTKNILTKYQYFEEQDQNKLTWSVLNQFKTDQKYQKARQLYIIDILFALNIQNLNQTLEEQFTIISHMNKNASLSDTLISILSQLHNLKIIAKINKKLKKYVSVDFYMKDVRVDLMSPSIYVSNYIRYFCQTMLKNNGAIMPNKQTLKIFNKAQYYLETFRYVYPQMKKLKDQKYLNFQYPNEFIYINSWFKNLQIILKTKGQMQKVLQKWFLEVSNSNVYDSISKISLNIVKQHNNNLDPQLQTFISATLINNWYDKIEDNQQKRLFFIQLKKWCNLSLPFANLSSLYWASILNFPADQEQQLEYIKNISNSVDDQIIEIINEVINDEIDYFSMSLNNYFYHYYKYSVDLETQNKVQVIKNASLYLIQNKNITLQRLSKFSILKVMMQEYAQQFINNIDNQLTIQINNIFGYQGIVFDDLKLYTLKKIRSYFQDINQFRKKIVQRQRANWFYQQKIKELYKVPNNRLILPPKPKNISQQFQKRLQNSINVPFDQNKFAQLLNNTKNLQQIYWIITNIMSKFYVCPNQFYLNIKESITQAVNISNISIYIKQLLKGYIHGKLTPKYLINRNLSQQQQIATYQKQLPYLNIINWFTATSSINNPFNNTFFQNGKVPQNFSNRLKQLYLVCGQQYSPRSVLDVYIKRNNRQIGIYQCSTNCHTFYDFGPCGWPAERFPCPICGRSCGGSHNLDGLANGARRIGPCLYINGNQVTPDYHQYESEFHTWQMYRLQAYWPSFNFFLQQQGLKLSAKSQSQRGFSIMKNTISQLKQIGRLQQLNRCILRLLQVTFVQFMIEYNWIRQNEAKKMYNNVEQFKNILQAQKQQIYKHLISKNNHMKNWILGATRQIFQISINYNIQADKIKTKRKEEMQKVILIGQNNLARLNVPGKIITERIIYDLRQFIGNDAIKWDTKDIRSRQMFEKIINNNFRQFSFGQKMIIFAQNSINQRKGQQSNIAQQILLQQGQSLYFKQLYPNIEFTSICYPFLHDTKLQQLVKLGSKQQDDDLTIQQWFSAYQNQLYNYPLLSQLISNKKIIDQLVNIQNILMFITYLLDECDRKYQRNQAKNITINKFNQLLCLKDRNYIEKWQKFKQSYTKFCRQQQGVIQHQCKVIGKITEINEKMSIQIILPDLKNDVANPAGLLMAHVVRILSQKYNSILYSLISKTTRQTMPYSINPLKLNQNSLIKVNYMGIKQLFTDYSSFSVSYGTTIPVIAYSRVQQILQGRIFQNACTLDTQVKRVRNIMYIGQLSLHNDSGNYLTLLKKSALQIELTQQKKQEILQHFRLKKRLNEDQFYINCRQWLDSLQIIIITQKALQMNHKITIKQFVQKNRIQQQTASIYNNQKLCNIVLLNLLDLYELIEESIQNRLENIIPAQYRVQIKPEQKQQLKKINQIILGFNNKKYKFQTKHFVKALNRLISRYMMTYNVHMLDNTIFSQIVKQDLWPKKFQIQINLFQLNFFDIKIQNFHYAYTTIMKGLVLQVKHNQIQKVEKMVAQGQVLDEKAIKKNTKQKKAVKRQKEDE